MYNVSMVQMNINTQPKQQDHGSRGWDDGHYKSADKDGYDMGIRIHAEQRDDERYVGTEVREGLADFYRGELSRVATDSYALLEAGESVDLLQPGETEALLEAGATINLLESGVESSPDSSEADMDEDAQQDVLAGKFDNQKIGKFVISNYTESTERAA